MYWFYTVNLQYWQNIYRFFFVSSNFHKILDSLAICVHNLSEFKQNLWSNRKKCLRKKTWNLFLVCLVTGIYSTAWFTNSVNSNILWMYLLRHIFVFNKLPCKKLHDIEIIFMKHCRHIHDVYLSFSVLLIKILLSTMFINLITILFCLLFVYLT